MGSALPLAAQETTAISTWTRQPWPSTGRKRTARGRRHQFRSSAPPVPRGRPVRLGVRGPPERPVPQVRPDLLGLKDPLGPKDLLGLRDPRARLETPERRGP